MAARRQASKPKTRHQDTRWFLSKAHDNRGDPRYGYWEYWDGSGWAERFVNAMLYTAAEDACEAALKAAQRTGARVGTHAVGPECGGCFVVCTAYGFWTGSGWANSFVDATQWHHGPVFGANMVRCSDPWKACHEEGERVKAASGVPTTIAYIPKVKWAKTSYCRPEENE